MTVRVRVKVHGLVQGVGFRFSTVREAERLGLDGWVKNLLDGTVEAEILGDADLVETMVQWLGHGPRTARVDRVELLRHEEMETTQGDEAAGGGAGSGFRIV